MIKKILLGLIRRRLCLRRRRHRPAGRHQAHAAAEGRISRPATTPSPRIAEIPAGGAAGRHNHPGIESGYVLEGEGDLLIDGQPPLHLKAGNSYQIPAGAIHDAKVSGDKPLKVLGVYVVDKTKPLASPAPEK